jgi:hypothetical protein
MRTPLRWTAVPALLLVAAAGMRPVAAAPVATSRVALVDVEVTASSGAVDHLELQATSAATGDRLGVTLVRCTKTCSDSRYFEGALPTGALTLDAHAANGRLTTVLGGLSLRVTWTATTGTGEETGYVDGSDSAPPNAGMYGGESSLAAVTVGQTGCQGPASVGNEVDVRTGNAAAPAPLSSVRLRAGAVTCTR